MESAFATVICCVKTRYIKWIKLKLKLKLMEAHKFPFLFIQDWVT